MEAIILKTSGARKAENLKSFTIDYAEFSLWLNMTTDGNKTIRGVVIQVSTAGYPQTPYDGTRLDDIAVSPNTLKYGTGHYGLSNNTIYYYTAFTYNYAGKQNVEKRRVYNKLGMRANKQVSIPTPPKMSISATVDHAKGGVTVTYKVPVYNALVKTSYTIYTKSSPFSNDADVGQNQLINRQVDASTSNTTQTVSTTMPANSILYIREVVKIWSCGITTKSISDTNVTRVEVPIKLNTMKTSLDANSNILVSWSTPTSSSVDGIMIRYKTTGYPTSISDGTQLVYGHKNSIGTSKTVTTAVNTKYYFRAWCYHTYNNITVWGSPSDTTSNTTVIVPEIVQQVITSSGNFTMPSGWNTVKVFVVGGGGGTRNSSTSWSAAGGNPGAGGGHVSLATFTNAANSVFSVTVGAGGSIGSKGGTSSIIRTSGSAMMQGSSTSVAQCSANGGDPDSNNKGGDGGSGGGYRGYNSLRNWSGGYRDGDTTSWWDSLNRNSYSGGDGGDDGSDGRLGERWDGNGALYGNASNVGIGQHTSTRAFGDPNGTLYANGGSGNQSGYYYWVNGNGGSSGGTSTGHQANNTGHGGYGSCVGVGMDFIGSTAHFYDEQGMGCWGGSGVIIVRKVN